MSSANETENSGGGGGCSCAIQRLLLVHLGLEEIATGKSFDECASEQELAEPILYFYSSSSSSSATSGSTTTQQDGGNLHLPQQRTDSSQVVSSSTVVSAEAIRFLGVCSALYTLPTALDNNNNNNSSDTLTTTTDDRTTEVYLDHCTLVFEPLEDNPSILLVAQIGRKASAPGATPASVAAALRRTHLLFALLRGGGIHERLLLQGANNNGQAQSAKEKNKSTCIYPGMDQLYNLRKQARKLRDRRSRRSSDESDDNSTVSELQQLDKDIVALEEVLPIGPLRRDLALHYDAFLDEFNALAGLNVGAACSIVECLPHPIPLSPISCDGSATTMQQQQQRPTWECGPFSIASSVTESLSTTMKSHLESRKEDIHYSSWSQVLGLSLFVRGQLAWTEHSSSFTNTTIISNETACLLMWYLASMRQKMNPRTSKHNGSSSQKTSSSSTNKRSFRPFGLSFGDDPPEIVAVATKDEPLSLREAKSKGFLPPPSLSLLSVADELNAVRGPLGEKGLVWAPTVHLPIQNLAQDKDLSQTVLSARICLYDHGDLSFLLYLDADPSIEDNGDDKVYQALFTAFAKAVDRAVTLALPENKLGHPVRIEPNTWKEPGQDIVFVDRQALRVVIHASSSENTTVSKQSFSTPTQKRHDSSKGEGDCQTRDSRHVDMETSSLPGFDCRHYLASHFCLDSLLAFADAMKEISQREGTDPSDNNINDHPYEMCSSIPQGWMLAMAVGQRELYVLFDSTIYVTINDVQNATDRIRNEFLQGVI